jgi:hypothetical protein
VKPPNRLSMFLREIICSFRGHDWQAVTMHELDHTRTGRACLRCYDAKAHVFRGQYPRPR